MSCRLIWLPAIALAACGTTEDMRPRSVEYVTQAILAPNCGNAQCHSQFRNVAGYAFDTVENARLSLSGGLVGVIGLDPMNEPVGEPDGTVLMSVLTRLENRMPYDQPLPEPDIEHIRRWIAYGAPGAQCNPENGARQCVIGADKAVECLENFSYGALLEDCGARNMRCSSGACIP